MTLCGVDLMYIRSWACSHLGYACWVIWELAWPGWSCLNTCSGWLALPLSEQVISMFLDGQECYQPVWVSEEVT